MKNAAPVLSVPVDSKPTTAVSVKEKAAIGIGTLVDNLGGTAVHQLANPVYNLVLGVNPALIGVVLAVGRLIDAVLDPAIGNFSDNFRSRFGRRRPLIAFGALVTGPLFLVMFFCPPGWSSTAYLVYFSVSVLLYYVGYTFYTVPLKGLQYELTTDYRERTRVSTIAALIMPIGGILSSWLFALSQWSGFGDPIAGIRYTAVVVMVAFGVLGILPALLIEERGYHRVQSQPPVAFLKNISGLVRNRPLMLLSIAGLATLVGIFTVYSLGLYLNIYLVHAGDVKTASVYHGAITSAYQIASMMAAPMIGWAANRFGKRQAFIGCLAIALAGTVAKWFCYVPGTPSLMFIPMILMGVGMSGFWVLTASMMADVTDLSELQQGFRNAATVGAVFMWIFKTGVSAAFFVSGFVLVIVGFDEKLGGHQSPATLYWMRVLFSFIPALALLVAIFCVWLYPIDEERSREIQRQLALKTGAV